MQEIYRIIIRCPSTKQNLDTGIRISGREALTNNAYRQGMVSCRYCGQFHSMDADAFQELEQRLSGDELWRPNP